LPALLTSARKIAGDGSLPVEDRAAALRLLGRDPKSQASDVAFLVSLLSPRVPDSLQKMALSRLGQIHSAAVPSELLKGLRTCTPSVRPQAIDLLLRREEWAKLLLDRLEGKEIALQDLGADARQRLLLYKSQAVRERARKLLTQPLDPDRQKVIDEYLPVVKSAVADHTRGAAFFAQNCAVCHRLGNQGAGAGPDLASLVDRSTERMLIAILDPSRAVEDRYLNYIVQTRIGDEYSGMLVSENANSIVLASPNGEHETLSRRDIVSLASTHRSLMPDGFEQFLKPQDLADLLAYIDASVTPSNSFAGNRPEVIRPDPHGALRLRAANAEIYGEGVEFESQYKNLGMWNGQNDRAIWTVEVPAAGSYDVWLHWACHDDVAGNPFRFQVDDQIVTGKVPGTGTWDFYKHAQFGHIALSPGRHRAVFQADAQLKGFLIDLIEVRLVPANVAGPPEFDQVGASYQQTNKPKADPNRPTSVRQEAR